MTYSSFLSGKGTISSRLIIIVFDDEAGEKEFISGSRIRTYDLKIMSLASYQTALSRTFAFLLQTLPPGEFESPFPP